MPGARSGSGARGVEPVDGLSHVEGRRDRPLIAATIPAFLREAVRRHGTRTAAVFRAAGERWTYAQLARRADRLAAGLLSLGLYRGDRVGIWAPNRPEWLIAQFATARIGLVLVNVNPAYRSGELEYALNRVGAKALITARHFKSSAYLEMIRELAPELDRSRPGHLQARRLPALRAVIQLGSDPAPGCIGFDEVMSRGEGGPRSRLDAISARLGSRDPINIQFTSGTTGAPKGATLSHYNILNNAISCARAMRLEPGGGVVHSGTALPLLRHGPRQPRRCRVRREDGFSGGRLRCPRDSGRARGGAMQRGTRRAHDVRGDAGSPGILAFRSHFPAYRNHGGRSLPRVIDAPRGAGHALP